MLTQQLALVNYTGYNKWELTVQNHTMGNYTFFRQLYEKPSVYTGVAHYDFTSVHSLSYVVTSMLYTAHYMLSDLITASQPVTAYC